MGNFLESHSKWLRKVASEIRSKGHAGWGNTCEDAADAIDSALKAQGEPVAFELADEMARADVEGYCLGRVVKGVRWLDTKAVAEDDRAIVKRALRYIELRGDALPYTLIRNANLVRFESR